MSVQENKDLVRRYSDTVWNKGQLQRESEFVASDVIVHAPQIPGLPDGAAGITAFTAAFRAAMPDLHLTQDSLFGAEDKVVQIWTSRGIHSGDPLFGFPAFGNELVMTGVTVFRIADGRIAERWGTLDLMGLMQQFGVAPASPEDLLDLRKGWYM